MLFIVAYDNPEDGTRNQIAAELETWGRRVQYSVFECDLDQRRVARLEGKLRALISACDNIRIYPLCSSCRGRVVTMGGKPVTVDAGFYQV